MPSEVRRVLSYGTICGLQKLKFTERQTVHNEVIHETSRTWQRLQSNSGKLNFWLNKIEPLKIPAKQALDTWKTWNSYKFECKDAFSKMKIKKLTKFKYNGAFRRPLSIVIHLRSSVSDSQLPTNLSNTLIKSARRNTTSSYSSDHVRVTLMNRSDSLLPQSYS